MSEHHGLKQMQDMALYTPGYMRFSAGASAVATARACIYLIRYAMVIPIWYPERNKEMPGSWDARALQKIAVPVPHYPF